MSAVIERRLLRMSVNAPRWNPEIEREPAGTERSREKAALEQPAGVNNRSRPYRPSCSERQSQNRSGHFRAP
jgi:hypothetical protein